MILKLYDKLLGFILRNIFRIRTSPDFTNLLFLKEGKVLLGRRWNNFWFLIIVMVITFFAIGFASGSKDYLKKKMVSSFITWVHIDIPLRIADEIPEIISKLKDDTIAKNRFNYSNITRYRFFQLSFWDQKRNKSKFYPGRTIEKNDSLLNELFLQEGNKIFGRPFESDQEIGLIVTEKMLKELGYKVKSSFILHALSRAKSDSREGEIPLPIIAVVKELPGLVDFLVTPNFYYQRQMATCKPFDPSLSRKIDLVTNESDKKTGELQNKIKELLESYPIFKKHNPQIDKSLEQSPFIPCFRISIGIDPQNNTATLRDSIFLLISQNKELRKIEFNRYYDYECRLDPHYDYSFLCDRLAIKFDNPDSLSEFNNYLSKLHEVKMEMSQVETKKNYNLVSNLTQILSLLLILFSMLSINLFITNVLKNHLESIRMHIGTFKAFGVDYKSLGRIYMSIVYLFVFASLIVSFAIAWFLGKFGGARIFLKLFRSPTEKGEYYFDLINWWSIILISIILISSYLSLKYITKRMFRQTPGDLIYDRC